MKMIPGAFETPTSVHDTRESTDFQVYLTLWSCVFLVLKTPRRIDFSSFLPCLAFDTVE